MPLPTDRRATWPPTRHAKVQADIAEWAAWYSADPARLADSATKAARSPLERMRFWLRGTANEKPGGRRNRIHAPLAGRIAQQSANLLFGEEAQLTAPADIDAADTGQARLEELVELLGINNRLLEAAEVCAGLGGVYLRPVWDQELADHPLMTIVHPDQASPTFLLGTHRLTTVTFHEEIHREGRIVWRHLELHEPGRIEHGLYVGDPETLGSREPLTAHPDTEHLQDEVVLPEQLSGRVLPVYVPNAVNRQRRWSEQGRADIAGAEGMLDAYDETWSSWMRDVRLGASRLVVPQDYLMRGGSEGARFDVDQEIFTPLDIDPTAQQDRNITPVNFDLRSADHVSALTRMASDIVSFCGYSPETFGIHEAGPADSGRALTIRQGTTWQTKHNKERYFGPPLAEFLEGLLAIDKYVLGAQGAVEPFRPDVQFADAVIDDPKEEAERLELLQRAQAMSTRQRVRVAQPHLEGQDLDDEVEAVLAESGASVSDPGGFPV